MFDAGEGKYSCVECRRAYKTRGHLKNHLVREHEWQLYQQNQEARENLDRVALYRASSMKCALLLRDTSDVYKLGDSNRIMSNSKFKCFSQGSDITQNTSYCYSDF